MVTVNGKETTLKMDFGAIRIFNRESGTNFMELGEIDFQDADNLAYIFYATAKRGNPEITLDDIDSLSFDEIQKFSEAIGELMEEFSPEATEDDAPLAESPQS